MTLANIAVRLDDNQIEFIEQLKANRSLGVAIRVFLKALERDSVTTLSYLLGVSDPSVNSSKLLEGATTLALLEQLGNSTIEGSVSELQTTINSLQFSDFGNGLTESDVQELLSKFTELTDKVEVQEKPKPQLDASNPDLQNMVSMLVQNTLRDLGLQGGVGQNNSNLDSEPNLYPTSTTEVPLNSTQNVDLSASEEITEQINFKEDSVKTQDSPVSPTIVSDNKSENNSTGVSVTEATSTEDDSSDNNNAQLLDMLAGLNM
jgi:hypothetical protein